MTFHSILSEFSSQALTIEMKLGFQVDHIIDLAGVKHAKVVLAVYNPNEKVRWPVFYDFFCNFHCSVIMSVVNDLIRLFEKTRALGDVF